MCFIDETYNAFFTVKIYVFMLYGQSYAAAASTIGTDSNLEQSLEKGLTSHFFPDCPNIVAWLPTTRPQKLNS